MSVATPEAPAPAPAPAAPLAELRPRRAAARTAFWALVLRDLAVLRKELPIFIVRTIMVPAAVELLGDRIWWPSTAQGGGFALREHAEPEEDEAQATAVA